MLWHAPVPQSQASNGPISAVRELTDARYRHGRGGLTGLAKVARPGTLIPFSPILPTMTAAAPARSTRTRSGAFGSQVRIIIGA